MTDNLLSCLVKLASLLGRSTSDTALVAGLPLNGNQLSIELVPRAAAHIDLDAKLSPYELKDEATHFVVPPILLLNNRDACLLIEISEQGVAKVYHPPLTKEIPLKDLKALYTGQAFIIEPDFRFSSRSSHVSTVSDNKSWFWTAIKKLWAGYSEVLVASFLINMFALAVPLFTMSVYDRVVPNRAFETLWVLASGIFIVFIFDSLMRGLRSYFIDQASKTVDLQVSATILEKVMGIRMVNRPASLGSFANTIQSFDSVRDFITSTTVAVLVDLPFSLLFIFIIFIIAGSLVWVPIILFPLLVIFAFILQKLLIHSSKIVQRYSAEKEAILFETLNNIEAVKTTCAENVMQSRWEMVVNLAAKIGMKQRFIVNLSVYFSIFVQQLSTVAVIILGVYKISQNELTVGALIASTILASRALAPMAQLAALLTRYNQTVTSLNSLNNIMMLPSERLKDTSPFHINQLQGDIEFRNVDFQYAGRTEPVVQKMFFKINPGEHVGIIGRVGSGKTTIAKLMVGLLQPTLGSIFFDNIDQSNMDLTELRKHIGYISQDVTLFYGTLRENICFGAPDVSDEKVLRAIQISGIDDFIKPVLGSYESIIAEGGKNLSGGQRRVVALARALLLDPPIFIFDEPTHSMDTQTELAIRARLENYLRDKTFILMTHRTSMLQLVSRIILIDAGKIIMDAPKDVVLHALSEGRVKIPRH